MNSNGSNKINDSKLIFHIQEQLKSNLTKYSKFFLLTFTIGFSVTVFFFMFPSIKPFHYASEFGWGWVFKHIYKYHLLWLIFGSIIITLFITLMKIIIDSKNILSGIGSIKLSKKLSKYIWYPLYFIGIGFLFWIWILITPLWIKIVPGSIGSIIFLILSFIYFYQFTNKIMTLNKDLQILFLITNVILITSFLYIPIVREYLDGSLSLYHSSLGEYFESFVNDGVIESLRFLFRVVLISIFSTSTLFILTRKANNN